MSEFQTIDLCRKNLRWTLLSGASAIVLTASMGLTKGAEAKDAPPPMLWIELNGQFSQQLNDQEIFDPPFLSASPFSGGSHIDQEKAPPVSWDKGGRIILRPTEDDWFLSLAARYGKSTRTGIHYQLTAQPGSGGTPYAPFAAFQNFKTKSSAAHTILDFQVGKDVGIGHFGRDGSSAINVGARYAQFTSRSEMGVQSQPTNVNRYNPYNRFYASFSARRSFIGVGPSVSWDASATLFGDPSDASTTFDWGINAALLFGRQKSLVHHQATGKRHDPSQYNTGPHTVLYATSAPAVQRDRNVAVPNLGAFAGVSFKYPNAKISFGYRADFFFGAEDGGIDVRNTFNRGFYGPFASFSIGLGG